MDSSPSLMRRSSLLHPNSGSPAHSPRRPQYSEDLSSISPDTIIEAFSTPTPSSVAPSILRISVENSNDIERSFGIRAGLASKNIQAWAKELSDWPWKKSDPDAFQPPTLEQPQHDSMRGGEQQSAQDETPAALQTGESSDQVYWGSLPSKLVREYQQRIDAIYREMGELDIEALKFRVLDSHIRPRSRPSSSSQSTGAMASSLMSYNRMDEFSTIITATVLQFLPHLARLTKLMDTWTVRLAILREVPALITGLEDAEVALKSGWNAINLGRGKGDATGPNTATKLDPSAIPAIDKQSFEVMQSVLKQKVASLGKKIDRILDNLEGTDDVVPNTWIDRMDALERDYAEWTVCAERRVREGLWRLEAEKRQKRERQSVKDSAESELAKEAGSVEARDSATSGTSRTPEGLASLSARQNVETVTKAEDGHHSTPKGMPEIHQYSPFDGENGSTKMPSADHHEHMPLQVVPETLINQKSTLDGYGLDGARASSGIELGGLEEDLRDGRKKTTLFDYNTAMSSSDEEEKPMLSPKPTLPPLETTGILSGLLPKGSTSPKPQRRDEADDSITRSQTESYEADNHSGHVSPVVKPELPEQKAPSLKSPPSVKAMPHDLTEHRFSPEMTTRRASVTSLERISPGGVKRISITRSRASSGSSNSTPVSSPHRMMSSPLNPSSPEQPYGKPPPTPHVTESSPVSPTSLSYFSLGGYEQSSPLTRKSKVPEGSRGSRQFLEPSPIFDGDSRLSLPTLVDHELSDNDSSLTDLPATPKDAHRAKANPTPARSTSSAVQNSDDQFAYHINNVLENIPARIRLSSEPADRDADALTRSKRLAVTPDSARSNSRAPTPSFTLAPAYAKNGPRLRHQTSNPEIKVYHLSKGTGEAPIKLFVRLVGERGERLMVRVGGGWADLGEYLKEYANHHGRKGDGKIEISAASRAVSSGSAYSFGGGRNHDNTRSSPPSDGRSSPAMSDRSASSLSMNRPMTSLAARKGRRSMGARDMDAPGTPLRNQQGYAPDTPGSNTSSTSRSLPRLDWMMEEEPALGLAGPTGKKIEMTEGQAAWVKSMEEQVRLASAEKERERDRRTTSFADLGKIGGTQRLFKKPSRE